MIGVSSADARERDEAFSKAALSESPLGIAFVDTELRVLWANKALASLSGVQVEEQAGRLLAALFPSTDGTIDVQVRDVLQTGQPQTRLVQVPTTSASGASPRHWRTTVVPVHDDAKVLLGACCTCADITDVTTLADQFLQSQKLESVGLLANIIAHDFNNLLSVIQGYGDLLLRDSSDVAKRTTRIKEIRTAAEAAGHLSQQLLTLSRRNVGAVAPVDINLLVRTLAKVLGRMLPANVAHDLILAERLGMTVADPGQIEQVLMNLITNAVDAMPGGGLLLIETANASVAGDSLTAGGLAAGEYVTLAVTDNGAGMDEATKTRLFEPIFTTKPASTGTGVGLSAVRAIVTQLHGGIRVETSLGKGSTFTVFLPRAREQAAPAASATRAASAPGVRAPTLLLVEDHEQLRQALVTGLEESGYQVLAASSGVEATQVAAAHAGPIDLLLADVELPDAKGPDLAERLRAGRPGLRVLIASGFGEQTLSTHDAMRGGYATIDKPFTIHELADKIQTVLHPVPPDTPAATH